MPRPPRGGPGPMWRSRTAARGAAQGTRRRGARWATAPHLRTGLLAGRWRRRAGHSPGSDARRHAPVYANQSARVSQSCACDAPHRPAAGHAERVAARAASDFSCGFSSAVSSYLTLPDFSVNSSRSCVMTRHASSARESMGIACSITGVVRGTARYCMCCIRPSSNEHAPTCIPLRPTRHSTGTAG